VKLVLSWMREFAAVPAEADTTALASRLASCGFEVAEVVDGQEPVIDFEITANRPDCLSIAGLAREAAVAYDVSFDARGASGALRADAGGGSVPGGTERVDVQIEAPELCARYAAQVARVTVGPSPSWLTDRLNAAGVRPVNNVVDITNYVMLERGHPMHAFDRARLTGGKIVVRTARAGEKLRTLDGIDRELEPGMLVIADASRAAAVAGVMGGADSEVSGRTTNIVLESAWFLPKSARVTSKRLALKTEASARFERGADIGAPATAMARAIELLEQIGAGEAIGPIVDCYPAPAAPRTVPLRTSRIARLLGAPVPDSDVERILQGLGFTLGRSDDGWQVGVPTWRVDVAREADLIEEVGRHFGYDRLPMTFPALREVSPAPDPRIDRDHLARRVMLAAGFDEAVTFTFIERKGAERFAAAETIAPIANPLSEKFAVLRPSLLPGLLDAVAHNRRHGRADVRLFEAGACFSAAHGERRRVAFAWIGRAREEHWSESDRGVDFFDARGAVESLRDAFRLSVQFVQAAEPYLLSGRAAQVRVPDAPAPIGVVGQLHPDIVEARDVPGRDEVYVAELDLDALGASLGADVRLDPVPRFPAIVRDLSILVDAGLPAANVRGTIRSAAPATLTGLREFDRYLGKGIPEGRVSLSYHLTFRAPERTLTDVEVDEAMTAILSAVQDAHGAERR
jgi:phenylalanyl-tRNA synthetase beta chain